MVWEREREEMPTEDKPCGHPGEGALVLRCAQGGHVNSALCFKQEEGDFPVRCRMLSLFAHPGLVILMWSCIRT